MNYCAESHLERVTQVLEKTFAQHIRASFLLLGKGRDEPCFVSGTMPQDVMPTSSAALETLDDSRVQAALIDALKSGNASRLLDVMADVHVERNAHDLAVKHAPQHLKQQRLMAMEP